MPVRKPGGPNNDYGVAGDQLTTVTAADVVTTGLKKVASAVACLADDPGDNPQLVSVVINSPLDGQITVKTWQNTSGSDPTPAAATTFTKVVNWLAFGY